MGGCHDIYLAIAAHESGLGRCESRARGDIPRRMTGIDGKSYNMPLLRQTRKHIDRAGIIVLQGQFGQLRLIIFLVLSQLGGFRELTFSNSSSHGSGGGDTAGCGHEKGVCKISTGPLEGESEKQPISTTRSFNQPRQLAPFDE